MKLGPQDLVAEVEGVTRLQDRIPVLTTVRVRYALRIPPGSREAVNRALESHVAKCPTACSLKGAVAFEWSADCAEQASES